MSATDLVARLERMREDRKRQGELCAVLYTRHGWTWQQIGDVAGVSLTTVYRWAQPYMLDTRE